MQPQESTLLNDNNSKYKVVILGESAVGKTSIIQFLTNGAFNTTYDPTLYLDSVRKNIVYNGRMIKLSFWDTAGQQKFNSLIPSAIRGAHCALIAFDLSDRHSFERCEHWMKILETSNKSSNCPSILVGNKNDLEPVVKKAEAYDFAVNKGMVYLETSAKQGNGMQNLMAQIIQSIQSKIQRSTKTSEQIPKKQCQGPKLSEKGLQFKKINKNCCSI